MDSAGFNPVWFGAIQIKFILGNYSSLSGHRLSLIRFERSRYLGKDLSLPTGSVVMFPMVKGPRTTNPLALTGVMVDPVFRNLIRSQHGIGVDWSSTAGLFITMDINPFTGRSPEALQAFWSDVFNIATLPFCCFLYE